MLDSIITSKTRIKLLLKFFLNTNSVAYLRSLATEFDESTNAIRLELNRFEKAGLLTSTSKSNKKLYKANLKHPLFPDIHNILRKFVGIDQIIDGVVEKIGDVKKVYLTGDLAKGIDSPIIELLIVSEKIDMDFLLKLVTKAEGLVDRKIKYKVLNSEDSFEYLQDIEASDLLPIWTGEIVK